MIAILLEAPFDKLGEILKPRFQNDSDSFKERALGHKNIDQFLSKGRRFGAIDPKIMQISFQIFQNLLFYLHSALQRFT